VVLAQQGDVLLRQLLERPAQRLVLLGAEQQLLGTGG
jgi:hypothetical protein